MKQSVLAILLAAGALVQAQSPAQFPSAQIPSGWQRFSHPTGGFSVLVPAALEAKSPTSDKAGTYYAFTAVHEGRAYVVAYNDSSYDMTEPQGELTANRDGFIKSLATSLVSEHRFISMQPAGQIPAIEFTCESVEWECRSRTFMLLRRGWQVAVLIRRGATFTLDTDRFLDSFQILSAR